MASRLSFHYLPGSSILHGWDARCKLAGMAILAVGILRMDAGALAVFSLGWIAALRLSRAPAGALLSDLKSWSFFLGLIFLFHAVFGSGGDEPLTPYLPMTMGSVQSAGLACWRLGLILGYSVLFTFVTRPRDMEEAIVWFLKPFSFLPARRIALMVSLTIRFLPLVLDQVEEVRAAVKSRLGDKSRSPLQRAKRIILPVFRRSLLRADEIAVALAARGYREDLPLHVPRIPSWNHLSALIALCVMVLAGVGGFPKMMGIGQSVLRELARLV